MELTPLATWLDRAAGPDLPLPADLLRLYGPLRLPGHPHRPHVVSNFVSSLDGVVSLGVPGHEGGKAISGDNPHDRMVMGLLRAVADAVVIGAGSLRDAGRHRWTAEEIFPPLAEPYQRLRKELGQPGPPCLVIVTAQGELDPTARVFRSGEVPVRVLTTAAGARRLKAHGLPPARVEVLAGADRLSAASILEAITRAGRSERVLIEGGPHLTGSLLAERAIDELFLTLSPQIAGREAGTERLGLVTGQLFAPEQPLWARLVGVKRGGDHLFLRYALAGRDGLPDEK